MRLSRCARLPRRTEKGVWYRAIEALHWPTALQTSHTRSFASRFSAGNQHRQSFEILYLAEDHQVALYEVGAIVGPPFPTLGKPVFSNPWKAWTILNVRVTIQQVVDLTEVAAQVRLGTSAQELTGDWEGYLKRTQHASVSGPTGLAPTHALGQALFDLSDLEGFLAIAAPLPDRKNLIVFPEKLQPGSRIVFDDGHGNTHTIEPRRAKRRQR